MKSFYIIVFFGLRSFFGCATTESFGLIFASEDLRKLLYLAEKESPKYLQLNLNR